MTNFSRVALGLLASGLLAACGSTATSGPVPTVTVTRPAVTTAPAPPGPPASTTPTTGTTATATTPPTATQPPAPAPVAGTTQDAAHSAARRFATNYLAYSYGFEALTKVEPAAASVRTFLSQGRHVPTAPTGPRPKIIGLKFAPVAGGYLGVVVTYSTASSVSVFAFDISHKSGRWQAEQLEG